ncbi:MAG: hypothetical protein QM706_21230 [Nitrospira sp.]
MKLATNLLNGRIEWCRRQSAQARTEPEMDGWRAEEDGLRDALMNSDHADDYRLCPPEIFRRYVLGFQDGTALLRASRVQRVNPPDTMRTPPPAPRMDLLWSDTR